MGKEFVKVISRNRGGIGKVTVQLPTGKMREVDQSDPDFEICIFPLDVGLGPASASEHDYET